MRFFKCHRIEYLAALVCMLSTVCFAGGFQFRKDQGIGLQLPSGWSIFVNPDGSGMLRRVQPAWSEAFAPKGVFDYESLRNALNRSLASDGPIKMSNILYIHMDSDDTYGMDGAPDIPEIHKTIERAMRFFMQEKILDFPNALREYPLIKK